MPFVVSAYGKSSNVEDFIRLLLCYVYVFVVLTLIMCYSILDDPQESQTRTTMLNSTFQVQNRTPAHRPPPTLSSATVTVSIIPPKMRVPVFTAPVALPEPKTVSDQKSRTKRVKDIIEQHPELIDAVSIFQGASQRAVEYTETVGAIITRRNKERLDEYAKRKSRELVQRKYLHHEP